MSTLPEPDSVQATICAFVWANYPTAPEAIDWERSYIDQGIMDSLGLLELVAFLQDEYDLEIPDEHLTYENFGGVQKTAEYIARRKDKTCST